MQLWLPRLHVHSGRHEALAARDVGSRRLAVGRVQVVAVVAVGDVVLELVDVVVFGRVAQDGGAAAVQGSGGLVIQVLQESTDMLMRKTNHMTSSFFI